MIILSIKSCPEQSVQFSFLIHIISLIPDVKNWYIDSNEGNNLLKIETNDGLDNTQILSLLSLYGIQVEVES